MDTLRPYLWFIAPAVGVALANLAPLFGVHPLAWQASLIVVVCAAFIGTLGTPWGRSEGESQYRKQPGLST
jgi:hypothetical protein